MIKKSILIIEDDKYFSQFLEKQIAELGHTITASSYDEAIESVNTYHPDIAIIDINLNEKKTGLDVLDYTDKKGIYSIILTDNSSIDLIAEAYQRGCDSFLTKNQSEVVIKNIIKNYISNTGNSNFLEFIDFHTAHNDLKAELTSLPSRLNTTNRPVLLLGENGTGRSKTAKIVHNISKKNLYHKIKLQKSSQTEIRDFLFGDINQLHKDWFRRFSGSTIYFDGIASMPLAEQEYLLNLLKREDFRELNIQITASATDDIYKSVQDGLFIGELLLHLSSIVINIPPLRKRPEDIPILIEHILKIRNKSHIKITDEAMECLIHHRWASNIKELFATITTLSNAYKKITKDRLPPSIGTAHNLKWHQYSDTKFLSDEQLSYLLKHGLSKLINRIKLEGIKELMKNNNFKTLKALEQSKISRAVFFRLVKRSMQELGNYVH